MTRKRKTPLLAISMGDPAGIGPEVILKAAASFAGRDDAPALVVLGDLEAMREAAERTGDSLIPTRWHPGEALPRNGLAVMPLTELPPSARRPGKPSLEGGRWIQAPPALRPE